MSLSESVGAGMPTWLLRENGPIKSSSERRSRVGIFAAGRVTCVRLMVSHSQVELAQEKQHPHPQRAEAAQPASVGDHPRHQ